MPRRGYTDLVASAWVALYAPAHTPVAVIERLRSELDALLASSGFSARMRQVGVEINRMHPDEFAAFTERERSRWAKLIQSLDLKIE
jgi:tripartite-type tricarboxylate transporter receptor subunit TctC